MRRPSAAANFTTAVRRLGSAGAVERARQLRQGSLDRVRPRAVVAHRHTELEKAWAVRVIAPELAVALQIVDDPDIVVVREPDQVRSAGENPVGVKAMVGDVFVVQPYQIDDVDVRGSGDSEGVLKMVEIEYLYGCVPEPKRLVLFKGAGHDDLLAHHPKRFARTVGGFLREFARPSGPDQPAILEETAAAEKLAEARLEATSDAGDPAVPTPPANPGVDSAVPAPSEIPQPEAEKPVKA